MWLISPFWIILIVENVIGSPVIIKSGIVKNHGEHENGNLYGALANSGVMSYANNQGYDKLNQGKFVKAEEEGSYLQKDADKNIKQDQGYYTNENFQQNGGGSVLDSEKKTGHKKGHHKSGFHNTYHKDESGSNSSYFDDANDEGGDYQYDGKRNHYGNNGQQKQQGSFSDGSHHEKDNSREGSFKHGGHLNKNLGTNKNYHDERYLNDQKQQSESVAANEAGVGGKEYAEGHRSQEYYPPRNYYKPVPYVPQPKPQFHNQYQPPLQLQPQPQLQRRPQQYYPQDEYYEKTATYNVPEKKIIIYEDPRVYDNNLRYTDYDNVRLEIRPPISRTSRYYDERPIYEDRSVYDDYYY